MTNFKVKKSTLLDALQIAVRGTAKGVIPILESFLFDLNGATLTICGSNLEVFVSTSIEVESTKKAKVKFAVPSARILGLLRDLPEVILDITVEPRQIDRDEKPEASIFYTITIKAGKGRFSIPCEDGENFPVMKTENTDRLKIPSECLLNGIEKTLFAVSKDMVNPKLTGVNMCVDDTGVTFAGCDGLVLGTVTVDLPNVGHSTVTIPAKALAIVQSLNPAEDVDMIINERNISFILDSGVIVRSSLIDDKYPDYRSIIPVANNRKVSISRTELIGAIKRTGQFADNTINLVKLSFSAKTLAITAKNAYGEEASEQVDCSLQGEPLDIWLQVSQLLPVLTRVAGNTIWLHMSAVNKAVVFTETDRSVEDRSNLMLAMPGRGE